MKPVQNTDQSMRRNRWMHQRKLEQLQAAIRQGLDITHFAHPEAVYEISGLVIQVYALPDDHPADWPEQVQYIQGAFCQPCALVGGFSWELGEGAGSDHLLLSTTPYALRDAGGAAPLVNRPADLEWIKAKTAALFEKAGLECPPIQLEQETIAGKPEVYAVLSTTTCWLRQIG